MNTTSFVIPSQLQVGARVWSQITMVSRSQVATLNHNGELGSSCDHKSQLQFGAKLRSHIVMALFCKGGKHILAKGRVFTCSRKDQSGRQYLPAKEMFIMKGEKIFSYKDVLLQREELFSCDKVKRLLGEHISLQPSQSLLDLGETDLNQPMMVFRWSDQVSPC